MENQNRASQHPVQSFFVYDEMTNISACKTCTYKAIGRHSNNLQKHIKRNHASLFDTLEGEVFEYQSSKKKSRVERNNENVSVKINKSDFENALLELVNINGRPFKLYEDSGMKKMIRPILAAFEQSGTPVTTTRESLQKNAKKKAKNLTQTISDEMSKKFFSLSIDLGTASDGRSVLAVNTQYMHNGKLVFRCLSIKINRNASSALRVALLVWDILKKFKLDIKYLISITSDNGPNVVKCIKILQVLQTGVFDDYLDSEEDNFDELEGLMDAQIHRLPTFPFLKGIRCIAHTLELCLEDGMNGTY